MYRTKSFAVFTLMIALLVLGGFFCSACGTTTNGASGDDLPTGQQRFEWNMFPAFPKLEGLTADLAKVAVEAWAKAIEVQAGAPMPLSIHVEMTATIDKHVSGSQSVSSAVDAALEAQVRDLFKPGG